MNQVSESRLSDLKKEITQLEEELEQTRYVGLQCRVLSLRIRNGFRCRSCSQNDMAGRSGTWGGPGATKSIFIIP